MDLTKTSFQMFHKSLIPEKLKSSNLLCLDLLLERKSFNMNQFEYSVFNLNVASAIILTDMYRTLENNSRLHKCCKMYEFQFNNYPLVMGINFHLVTALI